MAGLKQEVWTKILLEKYEEEGGFLNEFTNADQFVKNDIIHLADIGADPEVLINNTTFPIPVVSSADVDVPIALDRYDTKNTEIPDADVETLAYDVVESHNARHARSLRETALIKAAHAIAPQDGSVSGMPLVKTTGTDDGDGFKAITEKDVLDLKKQFDLQKVPLKNRVLILHPNHANQLALVDKVFADEMRKTGNGLMNYYGFKVYSFGSTPLYKPTFDKVAWGAVPPTGSRYCSVAFNTQRVIKAKGTVKRYMRGADEDPEFRKNTLGYAMRYVGMRAKNKGIGVIVADSI